MKNVIITGASRGSLGEVICRDIVLKYPASITNIIHPKDVESQYCNHTLRCDMSDLNNISDVCDVIKSSFPQIDIYINCTGLSYISWLKDIDINKFIKAMNVNFISFISIMSKIQNQLIESKSHVISICSTAANKPMTCSLSYNTSKAALQMAMRQLAREITKDHGVCYTCVNPSIIKDTNMTTKNKKNIEEARGWQDSMQKMCDMSPSGILLDRNQVSNFIMWCIENRNDNLSGTVHDIGVF